MAIPQGTRRMKVELPLGSDPLSVRRRIDGLEMLLERSIKLPVVGNVGLDAIVGVVPVAGDVLTGVMGLYLVWEARNLKMSRWQIARMMANVGVDSLLGAVPLAGDVFDLIYRSNSRNLRIVRRHLDRHHPAAKIIDG